MDVSMDELFGELRSLLQQNTIDDAMWRWKLCALLEQGYTRDEETYQAQWLPYLAGFAQRWERFLKMVTSLEDLERWAKVLPQRPALLALEMSNSNLVAQGAAVLANAEYLANLTGLDLSDNSIGDEGAKALANSAYMANLTRLDLGGDDIGDAGARALANSPYLCEEIRKQWM